jgi:hypothetical protein
MKRMIYCSQATIDFSPDELVALLESAREKNTGSGLTGMLLYCSQSFLQMLEGEQRALEETYGRIAGDARHADLRLLMTVDVPKRLFPDWTMALNTLMMRSSRRNSRGLRRRWSIRWSIRT